VVRNHFHAHIDDTFDFCGAANRTDVGIVGHEADADKIAAGKPPSVCAANGSAKSGADAEIEITWRSHSWPRTAGFLLRSG
jgi:hypothetical protein